MTQFFVLYKQTPKLEHVRYDDDMQRYIEITFHQEHRELHGSKEHINVTDFKINNCTLHDFGSFGSPEQAKVFQEYWQGTETLCPFVNEAAGDELVLERSVLDKHSSNHKFQIRKCNDTKREALGLSKCHHGGDIDEFIKTIQIDHWVIEEKFDYDGRGTKPIFLV